MVVDWPTAQLGEVAELQRGLSYVAAQLRPPGRPFVTLKCFEKGGGFRWDGLKTFAGQATPEYQLQGGELLIANTDLTRDGSVVGAPALAPRFDAELAVFSMDVSRLVTDASRADNRFLAFRLAMRDARSFMQARSGGSTVLHLQLRGVPKFQFQLPPLPEQRQIAAILDTIDDAIRKTEQIIAKLKQVKQGLLHDLLTCGIDDNGELRDPERHPDQFKDSPLGRIPRLWDVTNLEDVSESVTSGSRGWATYYAETGALFIRIGNLTREHINLRYESVQFVQPPPTGEGTRTALVPGDLLLSITADLGIIGVVPHGLGEAYVNQHIALVRVRPDAANSRWLGHYLASQTGHRQIRRLDDSGAKAGLNLPTVRRLLAAKPPRPEQDELTERLDGVDVQVEDEGVFQRKLRLLKRGLMEDLLSGRVRVSKLLESSAP